MDTIIKQSYEAPRLTVVTLKAEKGYAASVDLYNFDRHGDENMEAYETHSGWESGGSFWD